MSRSLRVLTPKLPMVVVQQRERSEGGFFWWGVFAVLLQLFMPYVVIEAIGIDTTLVKFHPSTILVIICGLYMLARGAVPFHKRCRDEPGLMLFLFTIPILNLYSAWLTGISGAALYAESFWSAGFLSLLLGTGSPRQRRILAQIMIWVCVFNVFVAVYESGSASNWFPLVLDPDNPLEDQAVNFRANAFFNHPLTASLITSMAVILLFAMRMRLIVKAPIFCLYLLGLLAYGGRTALAATLLVSICLSIYLLFAGIVRRNLSLEFVLVMVSAGIAVPLLIWFVVTQTTIADRIMDTLYYDGSAEVRATQWEIFRYISLKNWLFGITHDDLNLLKYQIGLGGKTTDIENFWILILLNLGGLGFAIFLIVFFAFLWHLGRRAKSMYGWILVGTALFIDSGSNSLGSKTYDLFLEVAFVVGMSGYTQLAPRPIAMFSTIRSRLTPFERGLPGLADIPADRSRGLRLLRSRIG